MSGEVLKQKLKDLGVSQAELARRLNVIPETIAQALKAKDIKSGFLEDLCRVLDKDISFFYSVKPDGVMEGKFEELRKLSISNDDQQLDAGSKRANGWMNEADVIERIKIVSKRLQIEVPAGIDEGHLLVNTVLGVINSYPNLSAEWIMTGTGEMLLPVVGSIDNEEIIKLRIENESLEKEIDVLKATQGKDGKTLEIAMKLYQDLLDRYETIVRENEQIRIQLSAYEPIEKRKLG